MEHTTTHNLSYKEYLYVAIPFVVSTITQPLLGAVDTAVLGHLDDAAFMGGVALGAIIFNTLYWLLGFLRISTSGFAAQSLGSNNQNDQTMAYLQPVVVALILSLFFIAFQTPIKVAAFNIFNTSADIWSSTEIYYDILIWGAVFVLVGYVNLGWLMGRKLVRQTLYLQVSMNVINIILDIVLVLYFDMGVYGVAYATLFSQAFGFFMGLYLIAKRLNLKEIISKHNEFLSKEVFAKIIGVNTNLLIRTICLLIMTNMFIAKGSSMGKEVLAANAVLFQIQYIIAYFYDGFANASSVFAGKAKGEKNIEAFERILKITNVSTIFLALAMFVILALFLDYFVLVFTDIESVIVIANLHDFWLLVFVIVIAHGLTYAGLYNGTTVTVPIRNSMIFSLLAFLLVYYLATPYYGNNGLWLAFVVFSFCRTIFLYFYMNHIREDIKITSS